VPLGALEFVLESDGVRQQLAERHLNKHARICFTPLKNLHRVCFGKKNATKTPLGKSSKQPIYFGRTRRKALQFPWLFLRLEKDNAETLQ
jgi:hypothetical protein